MKDAIVGVSDHGGWAILVTAAVDRTLLDRRRVELVNEELPRIPHHSEGQRLPIADAVALVERVRASAERHAHLALAGVADSVEACILGVALREDPELPETIAGRIQDYRASNCADWVMYRQALAGAAADRGWAVYRYSAKTVVQEARKTLGIDDFDGYSVGIRKSIGPPWSHDHKLALAAAIVAAGRVN